MEKNAIWRECNMRKVQYEKTVTKNNCKYGEDAPQPQSYSSPPTLF